MFKLDKSAAVTSNGEQVYGCDIISTLVYRYFGRVENG
jgi:hypothetical protein